MFRLEIQHLQPPGSSSYSLRVPSGCTCLVQGPSGSGKTLLLRSIADLDPNRGEVILGDIRRSEVPAHHWRRLVGYLPAESHWWEDRVGDHQQKWPLDLLATLGFEPDVLEWSVARLSTGERQRLALARLLANEPRALLLDEPVANLDADNAERVLQVVHRYQTTQHSPMFWVSHGSEGTDTFSCIGRMWLRHNGVERMELPWS